VKVSREQFTETSPAHPRSRRTAVLREGVRRRRRGRHHAGGWSDPRRLLRPLRLKADLAAQACAAALGRTTDKWEAMTAGRSEDGLAEIVQSYLSKRHRDDPGSGCVFAALGGEVARRSDAVRTTVTRGVRAQLGILEKVVGGRSKAERREQAVAALSGLVGAMVVARLVDDPALSNEILTVAVGRSAALHGAARGRHMRLAHKSALIVGGNRASD